MLLTLLKSKLHNAVVTECDPDYEGSISVDKRLMSLVGMVPNEKVLVANISNGERLETYAIAAKPGSGEIGLNGAAARKGAVGDRLIILAFALVNGREAARHKPRIAVLNAGNRVLRCNGGKGRRALRPAAGRK